MRIFAGPNGSGKSTIKTIIPQNILGHYLNPDEIQKQINQTYFFDFTTFNIVLDEKELLNWFEKHELSKRLDKTQYFKSIFLSYKNQILYLKNEIFDAYMSAILVDFLRKKLLETSQSFTFETVMSSSDKIEILKKAKMLGYKTYLYYIATESPEINILRIAHRVKNGGHTVSMDKVIQRYEKSLSLLKDAILQTNRAFIFDNSGEVNIWAAEIIDATKIDIHTDNIPNWFQKSVLEKV